MTFHLICQQTFANDWRNAIIYWHTNKSVYLTTSKTFRHTQVMTTTFLWLFEHIYSIYGKRIILFIAECVERKNKFDSFCFASAHKFYLIRSGHTPNANKFCVAGPAVEVWAVFLQSFMAAVQHRRIKVLRNYFRSENNAPIW